MIKGLYAAASAMVMNTDRQQTLSHNIANLDTPGFKQVLTSVEDFMQTPLIYSPGNILEDSKLNYVGNIGLGTMSGPELTDFSQGGLQTTNNDYDLAVDGSGFFRIGTPDGERYTRDGRFIRNADNNLVTVDGYSVLDDNGQPITLPGGGFQVSSDGTISVNGVESGKLGLATFADPAAELQRAAGNLFSGPAASTGEGTPQVVQGALEASNANPTQLMTQLVEVARSYEAASKMVENQDEVLGKTISVLGRIG